MIRGHGDDAYQYPHITMDFSSNICASGGQQALLAHLVGNPQLVGHYPEPEPWSLERLIADEEGLDPDEVIVTNGATDAIYLIAQAFPFRADIPRPTFSEYEDACSVSPRTDTEHTMIWLCNPNNPTGDVYAQEAIYQFLRRYDLVIIDQSYEYYTNEYIMPASMGVQYPNLIQVHSLTKTYCVPGLRLGYITAHRTLTEHLRRFLRPWSVSSLSIEAGKFLLSDGFNRRLPDLNEAMRLRDMLQSIDGIMTYETHTNFILCQFESDQHTAARLKYYLAVEHHMLIRDASNFRGLTPRHFRVAAQTRYENDALVAAIRQYLEDNSDE